MVKRERPRRPQGGGAERWNARPAWAKRSAGHRLL